jgi:hypothetical protein
MNKVITQIIGYILFIAILIFGSNLVSSMKPDKQLTKEQKVEGTYHYKDADGINFTLNLNPDSTVTINVNGNNSVYEKGSWTVISGMHEDIDFIDICLSNNEVLAIKGNHIYNSILKMYEKDNGLLITKN